MVASVCEKCAKFARLDALDTGDSRPGRWYHHPDIFSLLESTKSCQLCKFLVNLLGEWPVERMKHHARKGSHTRIVLKTTAWEKKFKADDLLNLASEWFCEVWSSDGVVETEPFLLCSSRGNVLRRAYWASSDQITFPMRVPTILNWIEECEKTHSGCNVPEAARPRFQLPHRFLRVSGTTDAHLLHLITTSEDLFDESTKYIALSHCWGKEGVSLKTTRGNLHSFLKTIAPAELPNTFRDVITIARELGIRYVWIDSLCIIQDDLGDWQSEAAKMAAIFHHAYLTVSAAAHDGRGGCGLSKVDQPALHFFLGDLRATDSTRPRDQEQNPGLSVRVSLNYRIWNPTEDFKDWPLHTRGWIFQEILLSRRLLHIDPNGNFFWQCHTVLESEDGALRHSSPARRCHQGARAENQSLIEAALDDFGAITRDQDEVHLWWRWIGEFSRRKFTVPQDDLPALLGIINLYQNLTGDTPVIGLWGRKLHLHIAWRVISPKDCKRNWDFPSWTWISFTQESRKGVDLPRYGSGRVAWEVEVVNFDIEWEATPYISQLRRAVIRIRRHRLTDYWRDNVTHVSVTWDSDDSSKNYEALLGPDFVGWDPEWRDYRLVEYPQREASRRKWLLNQEYLPLWITQGREAGNFTVHVLMLHLTSGGQYRRLALAELQFQIGKVEDGDALFGNFLREFEYLDTIELV